MKRFLIVIGILAASTPLHAQCSWAVSPADIAFGTYSVFGGAANTTTTSGSVQCTGAYSFQVISSTGSGGSYAPRKMGAAQYNVYINATHTNVWGDGSAGTSVYAFFNAGGTNTYSGSAYGNVPGGQDLVPGNYSDTIAVTLQYRPLAGGAWTNVAPRNIRVTMNVQAECRADTFNLTFGNYSPLSGAALPQTSTVKIYCTNGTPATFALDNGSNASGAQKRMASGANFLNYTASLASGAGTSGSALTPIGGGITLNGSIPASQDVPVGNYIDTLQVLVNY